MFKNRNFTFVSLFLICLIVLGCDTPISEYNPKTPEEAAIISVLIKYQKAKNEHAIKKLMPLLHDRGEFSYACGIMISKEELKARLPEFWERMRLDKLAVVPLAHECLNGDYYSSAVLKEPIVEVTGNTARARVWLTKRFSSSLLLFLNLVREDEQWLITHTEWGPS